jgi:hexosaminidase
LAFGLRGGPWNDGAMIPYPASIRRQPGELSIVDPVTVSADSELDGVADWLGALSAFRRVTGAAVARLSMAGDLPPEGYRLTVRSDGIRIAAGDPAGAFYGAQTLRQLLPVTGKATALPLVEVTDAPRYGWRGAMLDVARHFMPKQFVLRFIDLLAMHKLNVLHLHLTDDQGWRLEIPRFPKLSEVGSKRATTLVGHSDDRPKRYDGVSHGGFYTRQDIREIVRYAADRFITVVPEIEGPGHSQAAIAAYPELGATDQRREVRTEWGISEHVLNASEATVAFFADVLDEVVGLFPGPYLHIGGDECPTAEWRANPGICAHAAGLGLSDVRELLGWYVRRLAGQVSSRGRRAVFWYDTRTALRVPDAIAMPWSGRGAAEAARQAGHDIVLTAQGQLYLDHYQSADRAGEPLAIGGHTPLERVYAFDPDQPSGALGAQCQLWSEYLPGPEAVEYMAFPRLCAFSEAVWSPAPGPGFDDFRGRLTVHLGRLDALGVKYRPLD